MVDRLWFILNRLNSLVPNIVAIDTTRASVGQLVVWGGAIKYYRQSLPGETGLVLVGDKIGQTIRFLTLWARSHERQREAYGVIRPRPHCGCPTAHPDFIPSPEIASTLS